MCYQQPEETALNGRQSRWRPSEQEIRMIKGDVVKHRTPLPPPRTTQHLHYFCSMSREKTTIKNKVLTRNNKKNREMVEDMEIRDASKIMQPRRPADSSV